MHAPVQTPPRVAPLVLLPLVAGLLAVLGPATAPAHAATDEPTVGECRDLTVEDVWGESDTTEPIDCAEGHTSRVIAVGVLPAGLDWDAPVERLARAAHDDCRPALEEALGGTDKDRAMSAYSYAWFMPTEAQREDGARWIRCDLVLWGGTELRDLPTDEVPALGSLPHPDAVARCSTSDLRTTTCSRVHRWRATGAFTVDRANFPGVKRLNRIAERRCATRVTSRTYRWTYRVGHYWRTDHTVVCHSKTRT